MKCTLPLTPYEVEAGRASQIRFRSQTREGPLIAQIVTSPGQTKECKQVTRRAHKLSRTGQVRQGSGANPRGGAGEDSTRAFLTRGVSCNNTKGQTKDANGWARKSFFFCLPWSTVRVVSVPASAHDITWNGRRAGAGKPQHRKETYLVPFLNLLFRLFEPKKVEGRGCSLVGTACVSARIKCPQVSYPQICCDGKQ